MTKKMCLALPRLRSEDVGAIKTMLLVNLHAYKNRTFPRLGSTGATRKTTKKRLVTGAIAVDRMTIPLRMKSFCERQEQSWRRKPN